LSTAVFLPAKKVTRYGSSHYVVSLMNIVQVNTEDKRECNDLNIRSPVMQVKSQLIFVFGCCFLKWDEISKNV